MSVEITTCFLKINGQYKYSHFFYITLRKQNTNHNNNEKGKERIRKTTHDGAQERFIVDGRR